MCCFFVSRTPSCPFLYGTTSWTFSARLNASLKTSTSKILNVSRCWRKSTALPRLPALIVRCWLTVGVSWPINCHSANILVRREIDSLNERLTGDGQTVDGGDPNKGVLKTKGALFSPQNPSVKMASAPLCGMKWIVWVIKSPNVSWTNHCH